MSHKSPAEKLLSTRFRELAELRQDKDPDQVPQSLRAEVLSSIEKVDTVTDLDVLLNVGSANATADFLDQVVEPAVPENDEK
jgi:hypothetical protein